MARLRQAAPGSRKAAALALDVIHRHLVAVPPENAALMRLGIRSFLLVFLAFAPAACSMGGGAEGMFNSAVAVREGTVDAGEAARLISQYRRSHRLSAVVVDPTLMGIAQNHSRRMAEANKMAHVLPGQGSFGQKLRAGGFDGGPAAENVAAGQDSLSEVLDSWRKSPGHNKNLLYPGVTMIGIAVAIAPGTRYEKFWTLVLAGPKPPGAAVFSGPNAGPFVGLPTATGATLTIN